MTDEELKRHRQEVLGLYSIKELCTMFQCSRGAIDYAINSGELKYMSPNNRSRYVLLKDYLYYIENKKGY